jgi:hypothetical protein
MNVDQKYQALNSLVATADQRPASVELFYSYAHRDALLCQALRNHLTGLKRSGLIRDWYDHEIEPGSEWSVEIKEAMERAGIILLLVSADFVASEYINNIEMPFALERHKSGHAKVIPVLLRPVEWHDLPFAKLQVLPSGALAVTAWANQDEAFADVAGRLRELLYNQRPREVAVAEPSVAVTRVTQERILDAAIASSVVIDEPTDVVTMVRTTESGGLKAILQVDRTYSPTSEDVQSKMFELDFPSDSSAEILPATLELALESPDFDPATQRKKIRVPPKGDSDVSVFMLTPKRAGRLRLNLQVLSANVEIGSRLLVTTSVSATNAPPSLSYGLTSLPIKSPIERANTAGIAQKKVEEAYWEAKGTPDTAFSRKEETVSRLPSGGKKKRKKSSRKKSELDSALDQIGDESAAAAVKEFQDLLGEAKGDTSELVRQNAEELERRLVLLKDRKIDKEDFYYFLENQKRDLRVYVDAQPAQEQERAEKLTLHVLEIAVTKVVPILIAMI